MKTEKEITIHNDEKICGFFGEYRWLSNFHPCPVKGRSLIYPSAEHAYQATKHPPKERERFLHISAALAKKWGKLGTFYSKMEWQKVKYDVMLAIVRAKFKQNLDLRDKLNDTGSKYLEETNWWGDTYWGVCDGTGKNYLGEILMKVRKEL